MTYIKLVVLSSSLSTIKYLALSVIIKWNVVCTALFVIRTNETGPMMYLVLN